MANIINITTYCGYLSKYAMLLEFIRLFTIYELVCLPHLPFLTAKRSRDKFGGLIGCRGKCLRVYNLFFVKIGFEVENICQI